MKKMLSFIWKSFTIKLIYLIQGSGLEDINGVFEESNTYQPSVPSSEAEIIVIFVIFFKIQYLHILIHASHHNFTDLTKHIWK